MVRVGADFLEVTDLVRHFRQEREKLFAPPKWVHAVDGVTFDIAAAETLAFLRAHIPEARTVPLCGNSIGTDRRFLAVYLPDIENHLHYRSVDVSTIKELATRWYPGALGRAPKKSSSHRALDDIRESVNELRYYREHLFRPAGPAAAEPAAPATPDTEV